VPTTTHFLVLASRSIALYPAANSIGEMNPNKEVNWKRDWSISYSRVEGSVFPMLLFLHSNILLIGITREMQSLWDL
ncbi:MAG TPA: hypothetical protein VFN35_20810, partial [Ktedonobacteraceae bacterium]|nr:hypothetical protein [Ktedonobacteraceae bacterium]